MTQSLDRDHAENFVDREMNDLQLSFTPGKKLS